jgi:hypothetical protein
VRRLEPLHAAAFLIDQHGRVRTADNLAKLRDQSANLVGLPQVAGEQD